MLVVNGSMGSLVLALTSIILGPLFFDMTTGSIYDLNPDLNWIHQIYRLL